MVDCPAPESRTKGNGPWPPMQTLTDSATWPATVLTVSGTFSLPPGRVVAPPHPAATGRANVTSGSTRTVAGPGPLTAAANPSASTVAPMAMMAAISHPRCPPTAP